MDKELGATYNEQSIV